VPRPRLRPPLAARRGTSVVRPSSYRPFLQSFYLPERPATRTDSGRPWSVPAIIPFRSREMAFIISRLAISYRALRSAPRPASNRSGLPKVTVTLAGRGRRRPFGHARPEPLMYTGTTAAPLDTASRPAPGLADRMSPSSPRVPSGNTRSAPPSSSTRRAVRKALGSAPSRRIGRALSAWINVRNRGISKSSALARYVSWRPDAPPTSGGSRTLEGLATIRTRPRPGVFSLPPHSRRDISPLSAPPGIFIAASNQLPPPPGPRAPSSCPLGLP